MGFGPREASVMVISKMPNSDNYQSLIEDSLERVGLGPKDVYYTAALKCRNFELSSGNAQVKQCKEYLDQELAAVNPDWVLSFGNEALFATTGRSGITKYRTKIMKKDDRKIIATVSPAAVNRNPGQKAGWEADLQFFAAQVKGKSGKVKFPGMSFIDTKKKFEALKKLLKQTELLSYDVETVGFNEFDDRGAIVSLSGTSIIRSGKLVVWGLPLAHPESPFRKNWRIALKQIAKLIEAIPKQIAHNGKFDARWLRRYGVRAKVTFDTMLACHLLDENRLKGLKPQATSRFGIADWGIDTDKLLETPIREVLWYNGKDTFYTYHIYLETKEELLSKPRLLRIFKLIIIEANEELIEAERRGIWIDRERLATNTKIASDMRDELERQLHEWIPKPSDKIRWPHKGKSARFAEINFNASNWLRWWLFDYLDLPVLERGKPKDTAEGEIPGAPSVKEAVMMELKPLHPAVKILLDRVKWQKYSSSFFPSYAELADVNDRIHTTFKLAGTVTGRLSSAKEDADKVRRVDNRGVNIQQVPRDPLVRGLFGAAPGYTFVEVDFSQVELRVVCFLSRDRTMLRLYRNGEDIHLATASWVMGLPPSQVTKEDRKKAKAINFGFAYGMGAKKFVMTAFEKYELHFSLDEATEIRRLFFQQFKGLLPWHARQRRIVNDHGRVTSPLGRVRNLPNIFSEDFRVRAEAERQAINSPVQSFASDMNLIAMIETMKKLRKKKLEAYPLGTVHDATLFEIKTEHLAPALPIIKNTFENLPLKKKFGVDLDIPIVADVKVGTHWGDAQELSEWEIHNYDKIPF
jgi:DNA polymerase-1